MGVLYLEALKQPTTYTEQIAKLRERGCVIENDALCEQILRQINYYRLTAYFLPFRQNDHYQPGLTIERVYRIYEFDRKMRTLLLSVAEEIEIYLRTQLAYFHAHTYGAVGYKEPDNFNQRHNSEKFQKLWETAVEDNKGAQFVKHHIEKYGGVFPIWVLIELFSFGMLSHFYADLKAADQRKIANQSFGVLDKELTSWLKCCSELRNICAHYGRLYYRKMPSIPKRNSAELYDMNQRLFSHILVLKYLYQSADKWNNSFLEPLSALIAEYSSDIELDHIGFPDNWEDLLKKA